MHINEKFHGVFLHYERFRYLTENFHELDKIQDKAKNDVTVRISLEEKVRIDTHFHEYTTQAINSFVKNY